MDEWLRVMAAYQHRSIAQQLTSVIQMFFPCSLGESFAA